MAEVKEKEGTDPRCADVRVDLSRDEPSGEFGLDSRVFSLSSLQSEAVFPRLLREFS